MGVIDRIKKIGERWFLTEPLLFAVYCSHEFCENDSLNVAMRTGNRKVEIAPKILDKITDVTLTEFLRIEMFRILLKHPYQRQPPFASKPLLTRASNVTITDVYEVSQAVKNQMSGTELDLPCGLCFEEYYNLLKEMAVTSDGAEMPANGGGFQSEKHAVEILINSEFGEQDERASEKSRANGNGDEINVGGSAQSEEHQDGEKSGMQSGGHQGNNSRNSLVKSDTQNERDAQIAELWDEDESTCCDINGFIEIAEASNNWGSIPGKLQGIIKASMKVDMDYRKMLSQFKTSVISSKRRLTRMRPNRRFGFNAMGCRYELSTNLLIAVDVSGSVTDKSLQFFFSVINRLFKYGIEKLDILQFDAEIQSEPEPLKKACKTVKIIGRGGTNFQPATDYYCAHPEYDGLIYFTDGYAPPPKFNTKRPIDVLWVLCGKSAYEKNSSWIKKLKRNRVTYIPDFWKLYT